MSFRKRAENHLWSRARRRSGGVSSHGNGVSFSSKQSVSQFVSMCNIARPRASPVSFCMIYAANGNEASFSPSFSFLLHLPPFFLLLRHPLHLPLSDRTGRHEIALAAAPREEIRELNIAPRSRTILSRLRISLSLSRPHVSPHLSSASHAPAINRLQITVLTALNFSRPPPSRYAGCSSLIEMRSAIPEAVKTNDEFRETVREQRISIRPTSRVIFRRCRFIASSK